MIVQVKECCLIHHLACSVCFGKGQVSHSDNNSSPELSGGAGKAHTQWVLPTKGRRSIDSWFGLG